MLPPPSRFALPRSLGLGIINSRHVFELCFLRAPRRPTEPAIFPPLLFVVARTERPCELNPKIAPIAVVLKLLLAKKKTNLATKISPGGEFLPTLPELK